MDIRRIVQTAFVFLTNAYWLFPFGGAPMYAGRLKAVCAPGLNCYSCPAATSACPLGALQNAFAGMQPNLSAGIFQPGFYVMGFLGSIGMMVGRMPCAWACPFGLFQELMYKIPTSRSFGVPKLLTHLRFFFLAFFVVLLPLFAVDDFGFGSTWYCKYVCPAGTIEAGFPQLILQPELREILGALFYNKLAIALFFLAWLPFTNRAFCRTACPLGAIYGLFNKVSIFRLNWDEDKCTSCGKCRQQCPVGIDPSQDPNSTGCIRCLKCVNEFCAFDALSHDIGLEKRQRLPRHVVD